jgi:putative nucleotidyltransferase with HDIG domain
MGEQSQLEARLREYETFLAIGLELAGELDLGEVLSLALEKAELVCAAETGSIWELDEERGELFFRVVRGKVAGEIRDLRVPLGEGIVGAVASSGNAEVVNDVVHDRRWHGDAAKGFGTRAILAMPLAARGRVIGVLQLLNPIGRAGFSDDDLRRVELLAGPLGTAMDNARLYAEQKRLFLDTVTALAEAVEKRDPYTGGHVRRVVAYSVLLGDALGLTNRELEDLRVGATLHDIGKLAVPDQILRKPAPLDADEAVVMKRHAVDGAEIVARIHSLRSLLPVIRSHHERLDGKGYPDRLTDREIPLQPRIVAVADTYDAMTTERPYRKALSTAVAAAEIERASGTQLCPRVVAAFGELYRVGRFTLEEGERLLLSLSVLLQQEYNRPRDDED